MSGLDQVSDVSEKTTASQKGYKSFEPYVASSEPPLTDEGEGPKAFWDETGTATMERAYQYSELGKFQIYLLVLSLIGYMSTSAVPYILTKYSNSIECDYSLNTDDKKAINAIAYICLLFGGITWSLLADTLSRKWTLVFALFVYSIVTVSFVSADRFLTFGLCRALGAFSLSGIRCMIVVYISEFLIRIYRGSMICCLQFAWVLGMLSVSVLPYTWTILMIIASIPPFIAMIGFIFFPDPPRFLFSRGREKAALQSFQLMHAVNSETHEADFPIRHLKDNKSAAEIRATSITKQYIPAYLEPKFICIPLVMLTQFVMLFSYHSLALFYPEMVPRSDAFFAIRNIDNIPKDCRVGLYYSKDYNQYYASKFSNRYSNISDSKSASKNRIPTAAGYQHILENPCDYRNKISFYNSGPLNALTCMPSIIWVVVKVDTIGRKFFITLSHVLTGLISFASYFMHNFENRLLFSCLFNSFTVLSVTISHCLAVELFPTRVRVLGVALVEASGYLGAILANLGGALSLGLSCIVTVGLIAIALAITGMFMLILPDTTGVFIR